MKQRWVLQKHIHMMYGDWMRWIASRLFLSRNIGLLRLNYFEIKLGCSYYKVIIIA